MKTHLITRIVRSLRRMCSGARAVAVGRWRSHLAGSPVRRELAVAAHRLREVSEPRRVLQLVLTALSVVGFTVLIAIALRSGSAPTNEPPDGSAAPPTPPQPTSLQPTFLPPTSLALVHQVGSGDTLAAIALRYGVPVEDIAARNPSVRPRQLPVGHRLAIPDPKPGVWVVRPGMALSSYARLSGLSVDRLLDLNPQITDPDLIYAGSRLTVAGTTP